MLKLDLEAFPYFFWSLAFELGLIFVCYEGFDNVLYLFQDGLVFFDLGY